MAEDVHPDAFRVDAGGRRRVHELLEKLVRRLLEDLAGLDGEHADDGEACRAAVSEGEKPDAAMGAFTEISDKFMQQWSAFVTDQAQAFFSLWRARLPAEKKEPKKTKKE